MDQLRTDCQTDHLMVHTGSRSEWTRSLTMLMNATCTLKALKPMYATSELYWLRLIKRELRSGVMKIFALLTTTTTLTDSGSMKCVKTFKRHEQKFYTEVFVVGDIDNLDKKKAEWPKEVAETGRGTF